MDCQSIHEQIGAYVDGELPSEQAAELETHVRGCSACRAELERVQALVAKLEGIAEDDRGAQAPPELWSAIEDRLDASQKQDMPSRILQFPRRLLAVAASLVFLVGAAAFMGFWMGPGAATAHATVIDYSVLLDGLADDVDAAVERFLKHYKAEPIQVETASSAAPDLSFDLPSELPGGFKIEQAYSMMFGDSPGVAARYRRGDEPLVVFFHPPVDKENLGVHKESHCIVGGHEGHRVEVGDWQLLHFTDPSTCHCLLSNLQEESDLATVMASIAPKFTEESDKSMHH
jgi:anti-sigma factor RsiW